MALRVTLASAMESEEPTMRNSNLLPVKAKGVVRLRSVPSRLRTGTVDTPESSLPEASSWMESALETI